MGSIFTDNATLGVVNSTVGGTVYVEADNTDNTNANSHGKLIVRSGGSSGGSAMTLYDNRFQTFSTGIQAGTTTFKIVASDSLSNPSAIKVNNSSEVTFNESYTFPDSDGSSNQVLATNGSGQLSFESVGDIFSYYSLTPYIVGTDPQSQYSTVQAAIDAAHDDGAAFNNPKNVYIKPGTYTENLTMYDGVYLIGFDPAVGFPSNAVQSVTIEGTVNFNDLGDSGYARNKFVSIAFYGNGGNVFEMNDPCVDEAFTLVNCSVSTGGAQYALVNNQVGGAPFTCEAQTTYFGCNSLFINQGTGVCNFTFRDCYVNCDTALSDCTMGGVNVTAYDSNIIAHFGSSDAPTSSSFTFYNCSHSSTDTLIGFTSATVTAQYYNSIIYNDITLTSEFGSVLLADTYQFAGTVTASGGYQRMNCLCTTPDSPGTLLAFKNFTMGTNNDEFKNGNAVQTVASTPEVISSVIVNEGESIVMKGMVIGGNSSSISSAGGDFMITARYPADGTLSLTGVPIVNLNTDDVNAYFTVGVNTGTGAVEITVRGADEGTWNWACTYTYQKMAGGYP